jgi:methyl-accepting chemotaxis protein
MDTRSSGDAGLIRRFYLTELFANAIGAPLAAAYGGFIIDFSRVSIREVVLAVVAIMAANQLLLALPLNAFLGRRIGRRLAAWRSGALDDAGKASLRSFATRLPLLQASLVLGRMFLSVGAVVLAISSRFSSGYHLAATFSFALYSSFLAGLFIYYFLQGAASRTAEEIVAQLPGDSPALARAPVARLGLVLDALAMIAPSVIASLGIFFLLMAIRADSGDLEFYSLRIAASLALNILTLCPILFYSRHFQKRRLRLIRTALEDMAERGDIAASLPTDLGDEYALTAAQINRAFDLFRLVLSQMETASGKLSGAVMSFSSQIRETVAATTQQASAVKEMVGTMEGSNEIGGQIEDRAKALSGDARESHDLVNEGFGKVQDTIRKMDEIKAANLQTQGEIGDLVEDISSIGEILDIINNVANQTRIIAFNAELEASSAGAAGTSFRIVAEEIRRLANSTVDSLAGIKGRIGQIQQGSERLASASEEGTSKIEEGMRLSGDLNDIFTRIRDSAESTAVSANSIGSIMQEQNQAFEQIFLTLKQISEGAEQVMASTSISGAEVGKLQGLIDELKRVLARFGHAGPARTAD